MKYDLIVIGGGPAGEKGVAQAAYFGKKVALVEGSRNLAGVVANTGIPSKALRETALHLAGIGPASCVASIFNWTNGQRCGIS